MCTSCISSLFVCKTKPLNDVAEKQKATNNLYLWLSVKAVIVPDLFLAWIVKPGRQ